MFEIGINEAKKLLNKVEVAFSFYPGHEGYNNM